ncbi:GPO family capsid scaffolding protein [Collimonas pratensis]|uniref:Phage capsid scaffolding (GPO) serine peptidase family protein n=1 Tax=Collimonas pratensis TaxID=279113 RepID=A0ABM5Z2K4_9BURK|nr:GPO family capsid scaffolding protein [Collimonas pratensis]AMP13373.1 phage capsid scaffolding (GPO) serine peptidase family protein [Collimonas pratensis]
MSTAKPTASTKSKFFRVAVEGATTDGRVIDRAFIAQMAANFDPQVYGARIWVEHLRSTWADGAFKAYGDVTAVKAEEITIGGAKKLALFAQISPTPELVAMNKARQKIYTSIEINPKFADTGEAYLVGLAVTDSPASLGTEMLAFAEQHPDVNPLASRKQDPDNLFTAAVETALEFEDTPTEPEGIKLSDTVKAILKRFTNKTTKDQLQFADITEAVSELATHVSESAEQYAAAVTRIETLETALKESNDAFAAFKQQVDGTDGNPTQRPTASGGAGALQTDF